MSINVNTKKIERFKANTLIHIDTIYRFSLYMVGNIFDAQDLVQNIYIRAYKYFNDLEDGVDTKAWLLKISKNVFMNYAQHNATSIQTGNKTSMDNTSMDDSKDDVVKVIYSLPVKYRIAVILTDVEGLSYKESSEIIGCSMKTFVSILYKGHQILRER